MKKLLVLFSLMTISIAFLFSSILLAQPQDKFIIGNTCFDISDINFTFI